MIQDRQTHVGCAAVRFKDRKGYKIYWVCNYSMRNVANRAVYVTGIPYTGCTSGPNKGFPALCAANEPVVNVPHEINPDLAAVDGESNVVNRNSTSRSKRQRRNRLRKTSRLEKRASRPKQIRRQNTDADYF